MTDGDVAGELEARDKVQWTARYRCYVGAEYSPSSLFSVGDIKHNYAVDFSPDLSKPNVINGA